VTDCVGLPREYRKKYFPLFHSRSLANCLYVDARTFIFRKIIDSSFDSLNRTLSWYSYAWMHRRRVYIPPPPPTPTPPPVGIAYMYIVHTTYDTSTRPSTHCLHNCIFIPPPFPSPPASLCPWVQITGGLGRGGLVSPPHKLYRGGWQWTFITPPPSRKTRF